MKMVKLTCSYGGCGKRFSRALKQYKRDVVVGGDEYRPFCSRKCQGAQKTENGRSITKCDNCGASIQQRNSWIDKYEHNFCSRTCSAKFANLQRKLAPSKEIPCESCETPIVVCGDVHHAKCADCRTPRHQYDRKLQRIEIDCLDCGQKTIGTPNKKYCDDCRKIRAVKHGQKIAKKTVRRSKNEIHFATLCEKEFSNVATNQPFFKSKYGMWDADVILTDIKIAVLWNGIWHYKQVRKKHSLAQVQARDRIKLDTIVANGYVPYIIKDMGKENPKFVESEFLKFMEYVRTLHNQKPQ